MSFYQSIVKRLVDIALVSTTSPITVPIGLVVAVVARCSLGAPTLFVQTRPGRNGKPFKLRKFRTMTQATGGGGDLLPDELRLTPVGRWLRATSLDELPELWNVLVGDMSLVGPRPLLMQYLPRYSPHEARRHEVRPGVTGLAQVSGRNASSWEQKFARDVEYVDRCSLALDVQILLKTAAVVLRREGISQEGHATMEEFKGSK